MDSYYYNGSQDRGYIRPSIYVYTGNDHHRYSYRQHYFPTNYASYETQPPIDVRRRRSSRRAYHYSTLPTPSEPEAESEHDVASVSEDLISLLPRVQCDVVGATCQICLEEVSGSEILWLPCFHQFHSNCIKEWLSQNTQCPVCRYSVIEGIRDQRSQLEEPDDPLIPLPVRAQVILRDIVTSLPGLLYKSIVFGCQACS